VVRTAVLIVEIVGGSKASGAYGSAISLIYSILSYFKDLSAKVIKKSQKYISLRFFVIFLYVSKKMITFANVFATETEAMG